jgi:N-acetylmuramoyl-L-alanine amidase
MSLRCHFDADGWLQGPINITHLTSPNHRDSGFAVRAKGMVQHTEVGFRLGTVATFMNPDTQVSAFFSVGENGTAHQYLPVGRGFVAFAEAAGNPFWYSCECEDMTDPSTPMTPAQMRAFAQILEACSARDGFPLQITDDVNGTGLITHGDGGQAWGGHIDCPGPVRKAQRPQIIALAKAIRNGETAPTSTLAVWTTMGQKSLNDLAAQSLHNGVSTVLRLTAEHSPDGLYPPQMATYLNGVFAADTASVPAGAILYHPKADGTIVDFKSDGDQTLQALSGTWHCQCSAIVRATAEHSPGAVFSGAMASYLDGVFSRSATHIPSGIQLYYQK